MIWPIIAIYTAISGVLSGINTGINIAWGNDSVYTIIEFALMFLFWPIIVIAFIISDIADRIKCHKKK